MDEELHENNDIREATIDTMGGYGFDDFEVYFPRGHWAIRRMPQNISLVALGLLLLAAALQRKKKSEVELHWMLLPMVLQSLLVRGKYHILHQATLHKRAPRYQHFLQMLLPNARIQDL
ncbi:hypothetical protein GOP47_0026683 [Adiantum capillus-veneris]|nr:hypothetical protein GOP47_0026683 [Adiantum capillus-veneris]